MEATQPQAASENGHHAGIPMPVNHDAPAIDHHRDLFDEDTEADILECRAGPMQGSPDEELVTGLCQARQGIERVEKSGYNSHLSHEYATYDDVMRAIAEPLAEAGVWCFPSVVDSRRQRVGTTDSGAPRYLVTVVLETCWSAGGRTIRQYWIGETLDSGDKQHYQLLSQLTKYALAKTLKLDTGDGEPEVDHHAHSTADSSQQGTDGGEPATERQLSYIESLQEQCRARGGTGDEHEILARTAKSKQAASQQIEQLKRLQEQLEEGDVPR